jgi:hypothetical protein
MPSVSAEQHAAMAAAAAGKSRLGIPKQVGVEFLHADRGKRFLKRKKSSPKRLRRKR